MSHHEYRLGLCPSHSDGGTGWQCGKLMDSTTTWTPNWRVLPVLAEKQNYAHFSVNSFLRMWLRCCWWSGGRWRRTARGWTLTTQRSDFFLWQDKAWERKKKLLWEKWNFFFVTIQTPRDRNLFRECTKIHLVSTLRLTQDIPKRSRDVCSLLTWRTVSIVTAVEANTWMWLRSLRCPALVPCVSLGRCIEANMVGAKSVLAWW